MAMREWLDSTDGKLAAGALLVIAAFGVFFGVRSFFGGAPEVRAANRRVFVDAETGKAFTHELQAGETTPVRAPSGKQSGYPAELCYWTKDGKPKAEPTAVLINEWVGKSGPTFCPDCGRLVRPHNPPPAATDNKPPPTEAEYKQRRGTANQQDER